VSVTHRQPRIGIFGAFDVCDLGELALRRVIERELSRRRPDIDLVFISPFGPERPSAFDDAATLVSLAGPGRGLDALVMSGDVIGDDQAWERRYGIPAADFRSRGVGELTTTGSVGGAAPAAMVTWFAARLLGESQDSWLPSCAAALAASHGSLRDDESRDRWGSPGLALPVVGDPILLARDAFDAEALRKRRDLLRVCGALPAGPLFVVQLEALSAPGREEARVAVAAALRHNPDLSVVVVRLDARVAESAALDARSALRFDGAMGARIHALPEWAGLDDVAASIVESASFMAATPAGASLAAALGAAGRHRGAEGKRTELGNADSIRRLASAFDALAARLPRAGRRENVVSTGEIEVDVLALRAAFELAQRRLIDERTALQAALSDVEARLERAMRSPEHRLTEWFRRFYRSRLSRRT
jgi:hypothetical protein